jgi:hypothetical protein
MSTRSSFKVTPEAADSLAAAAAEAGISVSPLVAGAALLLGAAALWWWSNPTPPVPA